METQLDPMFDAVSWPHESLIDSHEDGCTEPWIAELACALLKASNGRTVLETGGFRGTTSAWLALTLEKMGGGELTVCDIDMERAARIHDRLDLLDVPKVNVAVLANDVMNVIRALPEKYLDFAWVDDDHTQFWVASEINLLWNKMKPGGLLVFHDVFGSTDLQKTVKHFGGYSIDLPRLGPAGGIGVIQIPK